MKKLMIIAAILIGCAAGANAQKYAIGLRGTYGAEISFQMMMGQANRLELDLGFIGHGISLAGTYQWVQPINSLPSGFAWFYGVGADVKMPVNAFGVAVDGVVGIEYTIPTFPLQFSLDYRPSIGLSIHKDGAGFGSNFYNAGLGVRYKF